MRIRFKKQLFGSYGQVAPGDEKDVVKATAQELIAAGYAEAVGDVDDADEPADNAGSADAEALSGAETADDVSSPLSRRAARRRQGD